MSYHTYIFMIVEVVISILISRLTFLYVFSFCVAALFAAFRIFFLRPFSREAQKRSLWIQWFLRGTRRCVAPRCCLFGFFFTFPPSPRTIADISIFFPTDIPLRLLLIFSYRRGHWSSQWRTRGHPRTFADIHHNVLSVSSICVSTVKKCEKPRAVWQKQLRCWPLPCGTQRAQVNNGSFKVTLVVPADERNPEANKKTKNTYMFIRFHKYRSFFFTFAPISMTNKSISNL